MSMVVLFGLISRPGRPRLRAAVGSYLFQIFAIGFRLSLCCLSVARPRSSFRGAQVGCFRLGPIMILAKSGTPDFARAATEPGTHNHRQGLWVPGPRAALASRNDGAKC